MMFNRQVYEDAKAHAALEYPKESCGAIVDDKYIACTNVSETPDKDFKMNQREIQSYVIAGTLQGIIHSHPKEKLQLPSSPSKADMQGQISLNVPWGIIDLDREFVHDPYWWGDFILDEPLYGVPFKHGINDCYSHIRKWYWQNWKLKIPEFARDDNWWTGDDNLYLEGFEKAGFIRIGREELRHGDGILGKVRSDKVNHGGIFLSSVEDGIGVLSHHLPNRLSCRESANRWLSHMEIFLRYKDAA